MVAPVAAAAIAAAAALISGLMGQAAQAKAQKKAAEQEGFRAQSDALGQMGTNQQQGMSNLMDVYRQALL